MKGYILYMLMYVIVMNTQALVSIWPKLSKQCPKHREPFTFVQIWGIVGKWPTGIGRVLAVANTHTGMLSLQGNASTVNNLCFMLVWISTTMFYSVPGHGNGKFVCATRVAFGPCGMNIKDALPCIGHMLQGTQADCQKFGKSCKWKQAPVKAGVSYSEHIISLAIIHIMHIYMYICIYKY